MIVDERMVTYIRSLERPENPVIEAIEQEALESFVPIIRKETQSFLKVMMLMNRPARVLEVGTAVGFSAILMSEYLPEGSRITTIENYEKRIPIARNNFKRAGKEEQITLIEGDALAGMEGAEVVTGDIMERSYAARTYRANLVEEIFMEEYDREMIKVCTSGSAIGQVNGLSVTGYGDFEFGLPHRISCTVGVGHEGIIDLEREAELGGPIHTKAMMILKSYLTNLFARKKPLVLAGSLYFEQSYAGIEGDSASGAELVALLSALADVPVRLDLAFTGAVSHSGQIMAVGGVTRKIEGFFKVCARHGLTGSQGVIIPHDNVDHLMLSPDVLQAVEKGQFAIYPVRSIEEALTLLTGLPVGRRRKDDTFTPGSLYDMVDRRLERLGDYAQNSFRRTRKG